MVQHTPDWGDCRGSLQVWQLAADPVQVEHLVESQGWHSYMTGSDCGTATWKWVVGQEAAQEWRSVTSMLGDWHLVQ